MRIENEIEVTNEMKSFIGLNIILFNNRQQQLITIATKRYFNYKNWFLIQKERERRVEQKQREKLKQTSVPEIIKSAAKSLKNETKLYAKEIKEAFIQTPKLQLQHGDFEYVYKFNNKEEIDKWKVSTDAGYEIGKTKAKFDLTQSNTGHFYGYLSMEFDKPEKTKASYTGYANIQSLPQYKPLFRKEKSFDWSQYTHFYMKVRGDGRSYLIVLTTNEFFHENKNQIYAYPLYTRGGPYWQHSKIPFSKFYFNNMGRIADKQERFCQDNIKSIGISCLDNIEGPFSLEIDFIAVLKDNVAYEEFAYEMYKIPKYVANT